MVSDDNLRLLWQRFVNRADAYVVQWYSQERHDGGYYAAVDPNDVCLNDPPCQSRFCRHKTRLPLGKRDLEKHVAGDRTLGVYQLKDDHVKWLCFDVDLQMDQQAMGLSDAEVVAFVQQHTRLLARLLKAYGLPFLVETSGSKGYHVWLFFEELVPASDAMSLGHWLREQLDQYKKDSGKIMIEVFPKQYVSDAYGNLVKLPLGVHQKTGRTSAFVNHMFKPLEDAFVALRDVGTITPGDVSELLDEYAIERIEAMRPIAQTQGSMSVDQFNSLPCFINLMQEGTTSGARDTPTFLLACYLRSRGIAQPMAVAAMEEWNATCNDPPMRDDYLQSKVQSAYSAGYPAVPCKEPLFDRYCETTCRLYEKKCQQRGLERGEGARQ